MRTVDETTKVLLDEQVLATASPRRILATYETLLRELRRREVVRTNDAPAGQYAEWLAQRVLGGRLEPNSVKSHDLVTPDGSRVQVKARVLRDPRGAGIRQLSPFRSFDFDEALVLLFDDTYRAQRATLLNADTVYAHARPNRHVNGRVLIARDSVLDLGTDVTARFLVDE